MFTLRELVSWKSTIVALSTIEAVYMALTKAIKEAIWLGGLLDELGVGKKQIFIYFDSQSAICLAKNLVLYVRTKYITISLCERLLAKDESYFRRLRLPRIPQIC